ncbi:MBL fold metallo-hydrolase [Halomonas organivorans]
MRITFLGGTETVTGSKYLIETANTRLLVDCGLFQGFNWLRERNWQSLPLNLASLDAVLLTHAHLDHSGYLPVLYRQGFRGPVYTHHATRELCRILLADSGHLQEEDARFYDKHRIGRHRSPLPLYDRRTAEDCIELFQTVGFDEEASIGDVRFHLQPAGHILGAASIILEAEGKKIGFSGDVGRPNDIFMQSPRSLPGLDLLLLESTYGNRRHPDADPWTQLAEAVNLTAHRGGVVLIPSFAVGRAQLLQHMLTTLMANDTIPRLPVYLDSPMAINVSDIYCQYRDQHRLSPEQCRAMCDVPEYLRSVAQSKALSGQAYPHVIIAGSGMASGGRILHHFRRLLGNPRTTVLFTGYQAGGTRGAKMTSGADAVKIHGKWVPIRATVKVLEGLSGHGDYLEIAEWLGKSALPPDTPFQLVHGEPESLDGMRDHLRRHTAFRVEVARHETALEL